MKALPILALLAALLAGCGDPAPSTALAPEQKLPDTSKMTPEEVQKLHGGGMEAPSDRASGDKKPDAGAAHGTPTDRGG